jgi:hypothetical protein
MLDELFEKDGHSIYTFKKGDYIIRLKSVICTETKFNENLGITIEVETREDNSFRESPVEFIAIENNVIYLMNIKASYGSTDRYVYKVRLEKYSENWGLFKIPDGLTIEQCIT